MKLKWRRYGIIHEGFDASDVGIVEAAVGRHLVHGSEGGQQAGQSVQFDEPLDERVRLRPERRFQTVDQFGADAHLLGVVFRKRQLGNAGHLGDVVFRRIRYVRLLSRILFIKLNQNLKFQ